MGEQKFVSFVVNSALDVEVISAGLPAMITKAGELSVAAIVAQTEAAQSGDEAASALADESLAQSLDSLKSLGLVKVQLNKFGAASFK